MTLSIRDLRVLMRAGTSIACRRARLAPACVR